MIDGVTDSGFKFSIEEEALDDIEFIETLADISHGDNSKLPTFLVQFLGPEQKARLYDHCRDDKGRARLSKVQAEIAGIFEAIRAQQSDSDAKNS